MGRMMPGQFVDGRIAFCNLRFVLQGNQKPVGWGRVVVVIATAPGADVDDPFGATARCRAWPSLSAKMVAQKPGDSVIPPLSPTQAPERTVGASRGV
jgi:hypothetical protein